MYKMAFNEQLGTGSDPAQISPLNLAFVGDAVYSLLTRQYIVTDATRPTGELNKRSSAHVCATKQSKDYYKLLEHLTDKELAIIKRGRNASPSQKAKNASVVDYRNATGLEALFGYLYLKGENKRILELFDICWNEDEKNGEKTIPTKNN